MLYNCTEFGWHCVHRSLRSQKWTQIHFTPHFKLCAMKKSGLEGARKHLYFHSLQNRTLMNNLLVTQPAWFHYNSGSEEGSAISQLQFDTTNKSIDTSIVVIRSPRHVAASCPPLGAKRLTSVFFSFMFERARRRLWWIQPWQWAVYLWRSYEGTNWSSCTGRYDEWPTPLNLKNVSKTLGSFDVPRWSFALTQISEKYW